MSTPLHITTYNGYYDATLLLLQSGADPNKRDRLGFCAIHLASINGYKLIVEELLRYGVHIDIEIDPDFSIYSADDGDVDWDTSIHLAILNGHTKLVKYLIQQGANVNICNFRKITPLHVAIHEKSEKIIRLLLKHKANIHKTSDSPYGYTVYSPLACAIRDDSMHIVRILLQYRKTKRDIRNAIILAVRYGNVNICKYLLDKKGADVNTIDVMGRSLLHNAVIQHKPSYNVIKLLVDRGANIQAKNSEGKTPIQISNRIKTLLR